MESYIITGLMSAIGAYSAVWVNISYLRKSLSELEGRVAKNNEEVAVLKKDVAVLGERCSR